MVEFAADSVTMVRVVGEMGVVRAVADRVVLMVEGEILGTVPPTELFLTPRHSRTRP
jgi:polar amino acid transport system ATP-binding protein